MATLTTDNYETRQSMRNLSWLLVAGFTSLLIAGVAGLILLLVEPEAGSTFEATLGIAAAISGLAVAGFAVGAAVYAQVKGLWQYAPSWFRAVAGVLILAGIAVTVWNLVTQLI